MRSRFSHVLLGRSPMEDRDEPGCTVFATGIKITLDKFEKALASMRINSRHSKARHSFDASHVYIRRIKK